MSVPRTVTRLRHAAQAIAPRDTQVTVAAADPVAPVFTVLIKVGAVTHALRTGWAGEGWPADVERLLRLAPRLDAVAAHALSVGAREALDRHNIGWFDETGAAGIVTASGLVIVRPGTRRQQIATEDKPSWTRGTIATAEAILTGSAPRVEVVQNATGLSRGAVAKALSLLEQEGTLQRSVPRGPGSGRRLTEPGLLLDRYAAAVASIAGKVPRVLYHILWSDPIDALTDSIAPALDRAGVSWATTGAAASALLAPYLSSITVIDLYVDDDTFGDSARLAHLLDARQVERGHRIEVRRHPTRITPIVGEVVGGVRCAPAVRAYADLMAKGDRYAEAARHLREVRIDAGAGA